MDSCAPPSLEKSPSKLLEGERCLNWLLTSLSCLRLNPEIGHLRRKVMFEVEKANERAAGGGAGRERQEVT